MAGLDFTTEAYDNGSDQGYYQHIVLSDIINNFMVSEVTEGMQLANTAQTIVEYHAQRAVQELSYDTLRSVRSREYEPDGQGSIRIPQDAVGLIASFWVDDSGYKHPMVDRGLVSGNPITPLTDNDGKPLYDETGERLYGSPSTTLSKFNGRTQSVGADAFYNYYAGSFENDELYDRYYSYYGRRFGSEPSQVNINGTYIFDEETGTVFLDPGFVDRTIVLDYITDGLGDDISKIRVHKFSEESVYQYIKSKILASKVGVPLYEKQLANKEYAKVKRRAKHRLTGVSARDIYQTILNKQKWIKR